MRGEPSRARSYKDTIKDRLRPRGEADASKLPGVILFAAVVGVFPLAYLIDGLTGAGWLGSALGAIAIAAMLAVGAVMLIRT